MTEASSRVRPLCLDVGGGEQAFAHVHEPAGAPAASAVVLCAPFGNADICSYRARRDWAEALAAAGYPTLRLDLPSMGDSPGEALDAGRLTAWIGAVSAAAAWLRETTDCQRLVAIGIAFGGLLACLAAGAQGPIDDLVLWGVPLRGRALLRELRALASLEASQAAETSTQGFLVSAGFVLSAETVVALEAVDLTELELTEPAARRVLLLERDGIAVDRHLRARLEQLGAQVSVAPGPGYGAMILEPQRSRPPHETFARVAEWLAQGDAVPPPARDRRPPVRAREQVELLHHGVPLRESPLTVVQPFGELSGVLTEPEGPRRDLCAVLLNAGALRRIGPNRLWVELAREWAARGVPTLRLDVEGIGDADGDASGWSDDASFYHLRFVDQVLATLDVLEARGLPGRFVLSGLCSGAYWSFHAALRDERVAAAWMVNPRALLWDEHMLPVREVRKLRKLRQSTTWRRVARGEISLRRPLAIGRGAVRALTGTPARVAARRRARRAGIDELGLLLDQLRDDGTRLVMAFSGGEPLHGELAREGRLAQLDRWPNLEVVSISDTVEAHTLEPIALQRRLHQLLSVALDEELSRGELAEHTPA